MKNNQLQPNELANLRNEFDRIFAGLTEDTAPPAEVAQIAAEGQQLTFQWEE